MSRTNGTFEITMGAPMTELGGAAGRFEFDKTFHGGITGASRGLMLSVGDPAAGEAGYVALEIVTGTVDGRSGSFAFQQFGAMTGGEQTQQYAVVPGSASGDLVGLSGVLDLQVVDGIHRYELTYQLD